MNYYANIRRQYDTVLHPVTPQGDQPVRLYSEPFTPNDVGVTYRYTVRFADLKSRSQVDSDFSALERRFRQEFHRSDANLKCRILTTPVVYFRRERWNGHTFVLDDVVGCRRRLAAKLALALFTQTLPTDLSSPSTILAQWGFARGLRIVSHRGTWTATTGQVTLTRGGELIVGGELDEGGPNLGPNPPDKLSIQGQTAEGFPISCSDAYFGRVSLIPMPGQARCFKLVPLKIEIGAPAAGPPEITAVLIRRVPSIWSGFTFAACGRDIKIEPRHGTRPRDFAAWVEIPGLKSDVGDEATKIGIAVAQLLGIAHRANTPIVAIRTRRMEQERTDLHGNDLADTANPVIPDNHIQQFLKTALPNYMKLNDSHRLFALAEYYIRSFVESTAEHKFTFASIFMEAFKFSCAYNDPRPDMIIDKNTAGLVRGFKRPPTSAEKAKAIKKGKTAKNRNWTFKELMDRYAGCLAGPGGFTFIENRNALFHTGLPAAAQIHKKGAGTYPYLKPELMKVQTQMEDILLLILGYSGPIHEYGAPDTLVSFPGRAPLP